MADLMKQALKQSFLGLLNEMPLGKITVKMITDNCRVNRNSFYYHYHDIPELIEEIVKEEADSIISAYPNVDSIETCIKCALEFATRNQKALYHIYSSVSRDIFERYLWNVCDYVLTNYAKMILKNIEVDEFDFQTILKFYKSAVFGMVIYLFDHKGDTDTDRQISRFCELSHGMIEEMIVRAAKR
ncbi:MAG: TetR/AcrR family transcriptional regulator [Lachnospiraceae bacterium]|nr:TetR/AcrR family transcriptional regulator [Lachnospiraceae bacterium]